MKFCDKTTTTIEKTGILDFNEDGRYVLSIELKDGIQEYDVVEDILPLVVGKAVSIKSEEVTEG